MSNASDSDVLEPNYQELSHLLSEQNRKLEQELELLKYKYNELRSYIFGKKSEKQFLATTSHAQLSLLGTTEESKEEQEDKELIEVKSHFKQKRNSKKQILAELPVDEIVYEPTDSECKDCGAELKEFSRDERIEIEFEPAKFFKRKIVKVNCSCPKCKQVVSGQAPSPVIAGSQFGASFFAHLITSRFCDHLPYYRQSQIYERKGIIIPDKTLSGYAMKLGAMLEPVAKEIKKELFNEDYLQVDETRLQVLLEGAGTHTGQLWVLNSPLKPLSYYEYHDSRSQEAQDALLYGYSGIIQTDAYATYDNYQGALLGCMAHARRKFVKAAKLSAKDCNYIIRLISELYKIEKDLRLKLIKLKKDDWYKERLRVRKEKSVPVLNKIKEYLIKIKDSYLVQGHPMVEAINYMYSRFDSFTHYTTDGRYQIDNNDVERVIRPIAIGRKNWLFTGSEHGAKMSAVMMTVVQTCRQLKINPHHYLKDVLPMLADYKTTSIQGLKPMDWASSK